MPANEKLIKETKKAMGYTEEPLNKCVNCKHYEERDGFLDRSWEHYCTFSKLANFQIDPHTGRCEKYEWKGK